MTGNLRQVNKDPKSRFCTLKKRFCQHYGLLQVEKGFKNTTVQRMIDILGTHGDYESELVQVVEDNESEGQPGKWSNLWNIGLIRSRPRSDKVSKAIRNGHKLVQKDDTTFLTEICAVINKEPAYRRIVEEILQEAAHSLSITLKWLKKELLQPVEKEIALISMQEIDERTNAEKLDADQAAEARLCSLIRAALNAEADHPTNRYVSQHVNGTRTHEHSTTCTGTESSFVALCWTKAALKVVSSMEILVQEI